MWQMLRLLTLLSGCYATRVWGGHCDPMNCTSDLLVFKFSLANAGLTNQLIMLRSMFVVADLLNRDLHVDMLSADYQSGKMVPFCTMLDIQRTNDIFLKNENIQRKFCTGGSLKHLRTWDKALHVTFNHKTGQIKPSDAWKRPLLILKDSPLLLGLSLLFNADLHMGDFRFRYASSFYVMADEFKKSVSISGSEYNAVHFRVEDDWIAFVFGKKIKENSKKYKSAIYSYLYHYVEFIVAHLDTSLPLVVAVGTNTKTLRFALAYLRLYFPKLYITPKSGAFSARGLPEGRELYAIVDNILMVESTKFVGHQASTFSIEIVNCRKYTNSPSNSVYFGMGEAKKDQSVLSELIEYFDNWTNDTKIPPAGIVGETNISSFMGKTRKFADFPFEKLKHIAVAQYPWFNKSRNMTNSSNV